MMDKRPPIARSAGEHKGNTRAHPCAFVSIIFPLRNRGSPSPGSMIVTLTPAQHTKIAVIVPLVRILAHKERVQLIQHLSQLSFLLVAVKKQEDKPRRIGFIFDKKAEDTNT